MLDYTVYLKRFCIFGPKGAVQIRYYYYYYQIGQTPTSLTPDQ